MARGAKARSGKANAAKPPNGTMPSAIPRSNFHGNREALPDSIAASRRATVADDGEEADVAGLDYRVQDSDSDSDDDIQAEIDAAGLYAQTQDDALPPTVETILDTLLWLIPFGTLFLAMDIMIQQQYAIHPSISSQAARLANALPFLAAFIFFTAVRTTWIHRVALQVLLFACGTAAGCGFLYTYARSSHSVVTRRAAPLGTLWIFCVARMDLSLAVLGLAVVYFFTTYHNLDLF